MSGAWPPSKDLLHGKVRYDLRLDLFFFPGGLMVNIDPSLRALIEAIEAWPSAVSQAQTAALKSRRADNLPVLPLGSGRPRNHAHAAAPQRPSSRRSANRSRGSIEAGEGDTLGSGAEDAEAAEDARDRELLLQEEEAEHLEMQRAQEKAKQRRPGGVALFPPVKLSSSLRAPPRRPLSSMASAVPQREDPSRVSELGPELGPGVYATTIQAMATRDPERESVIFRSRMAQRPKGFGTVGETPAPDSMYANISSPTKPYPKVHGGTQFSSTTHRFDHTAYYESLQLRQKPRARRRETPYWQGAPMWDGPFSQQPKPSGVQFPPPANHAERLAAARASLAERDSASRGQ